MKSPVDVNGWSTGCFFAQLIVDAGKRLTLTTRYETREREKEGEKETKKDKRKKRCMPSFEYVSMHILPGAIRKDFRKILKCCNSRQAKAGHCIGRIDTMYSDAVISSIIIIQLH